MLIFFIFIAFINSKLYEKDLHLIGVKYTKENRVQDDLVEILEDHEIFEDDEYLENENYYNSLMRYYSDKIENYVKLYGKKNENNQYGLYADEQISNNTVLGIQSGLITDKAAKNYLQYQYYSFIDNKELYLDVSKDSNIFRFARSQELSNVHAVFIPYHGKWHMMIISNQDIEKDDEICLELDDDIGFGVFAKTKLPVYTILGQYTGIVQKYDEANSDHAWTYQSKPNQIDLMISAEKYGNILRFINDYQDHNVQAFQVPTKNGWKIYYLVLKTIEKDEELSVDYGEKFWKKSQNINRANQQKNKDYESNKQNEL